MPAINRKVIEQLKRSSGSELALHRWKKIVGEVEKGWVSTPQPITDGIINSTPLFPRFAFEEQHGNAAKRRFA